MTLFRPLLFVTLLAAAPGAHAAPPSGIVGVADAQLSPDFWVTRLPKADTPLLDGASINALNAKLMRVDPSMHDIRHLAPALSSAQVSGWLRKLSTRPAKTLYDVEGHTVPDTAIDAILANDALDAVSAKTTPRYGMVVSRAPLRSHATDLRVFSRPGDTDIDRFQESTLFPGDPVAVVHASRDGRWLFVVSERYAAWTPADDIAFADARTVFAHADATPYRVITGARAVTVQTPEAPAVSATSLDMGTRVPLDTSLPADEPVNGQHPYTSWILSLPTRDASGRLVFHPALLQRVQPSAADYLPLTQGNIVRQAFRFLGERYGWGHTYDGRDCSGFVSDVYRSMGVQMPRNTGDQAQSPAFDHTSFSARDGHALRMQAVDALQPGDLIYIPGHVMMVIGRIDGAPYVIHDVGGASFRQDDGSLKAVKLNEVAVTPLLPLLASDGTPFVDRMTRIVRIR